MKTEQAMFLYKSGDLRKALGIVKGFRLGLSKEDKRTVQIAYEVLQGHGGFYSQIGINTQDVVEKAKAVLKKLFKM